MTKYKLLYIFFSAFIMLAAAGAEASAGNRREPDLEGILAGMGSGPDIDAVASAMTSGPDLDAMLSVMTGGSSISAGKKESDDPMFSSVADAMTVNSTLDYLSGIYTAPLSYSSVSFSGGSLSKSYLFSGSAQLPIAGRLTSGFGYRPKFGRMHKGVDIALNTGDPVSAALDGTVERVGNEPGGYGIFVCIRHDGGLETRYAHLCQALVSPGMSVRAGQTIGLGGNTGNSTGPHLHFEARVNGQAIDPTTMFDFSMPGGPNPYRTLADLDAANPRINYGAGTINDGASAAKPGGNGKTTYIVRNGDTISSVARKNGISVLTLCRLNMLSTTDRLQPGRMLKLK